MLNSLSLYTEQICDRSMLQNICVKVLMSQSWKEWRNIQIGLKDLFAVVQAAINLFYLSKQLYIIFNTLTH